MKHSILSLLHLTKINKRLLVVLPPATPMWMESSLFFFQINGTEGKWRIEKGICEEQTSRNTAAPFSLVHTAVKQQFAGVVPQCKSSSQMKGVPCFLAGSLFLSVKTNKASQTARLCCLETKLSFQNTKAVFPIYLLAVFACSSSGNCLTPEWENLGI